ncbi:MAG: DNA primase [Melioribacteraceae bacterium]|nr:DNA primase [Melioribacteraceae bacterium]
MRIPEQKIDEIRSGADIVDIISAHVQLRKKGKNFQGLCPFHQEKTPSFVVSPEKQIFHCFGCHAGGNVYKFLMDFKSISFVESVQEVAAQIGIPIEFEKEFDPEIQTEHEQMFDLNVLAARFFVDNLYKSEEGKSALEYLKNRRLNEKTLKTFGVGLAKSGWDNFMNYASDNSVDLSRAQALGLIDKKDSGGYYDKFRGRIIFPIMSPNGRVVAFGGRILENNDNVAKYLNSPESLIYQKRKSLYGLYHSKEEIRKYDKAILVEGYMDLISLYQSGVKNVIASSGTALTDEQTQLLSRFTKNIVVLFDADTAGQKAAMRSIEILLKQDFDVKILSLPDGEDPDSFIHKFGKELFNEKLESAQNFLEYQVTSFKEQGKLDDPEQMTEAIRELVKTSALVKDELKRNLLFKSIATKFNLREKLIEQEAINFFEQTKKKEVREEHFQKQREQREVEVNKNIEDLKENPLERELIGLMFEGDESVIGHIFDNILPDDFNNKIYRSIAGVVYNAYRDHVHETSAMIDKIEDETLKSFVFRLAIEQESISKKWDDYTGSYTKEYVIKQSADDLVKKYRIEQLNKIIKRNNKTIEDLDDELAKLELMKENNELNLEKSEIIKAKPFYENDES